MSATLQPGPVVRASFPPRPHNDVRILIDGEEAFGRIYGMIDEARSSVWITVSFAHLDVPLPGRSDTFLDVITRTAARGVEVRLLFWWSEYSGIGSYRGDPEDLAVLSERGCLAKMRWDDVPRGCHHQKSYVIDGTTAFVGGINITHDALSSRSHAGSGFHDLFAELHGPVVADVACNFAERWNQATITSSRALAFPSLEQADDVDVDLDVPAAGPSSVQLVRTLRKQLYRGDVGWHDTERFDLAEGEDSIRRAVLGAIEAAERAIYIENQFLMDPATLDALALATKRGVEVIAVVPLQPDPNLLLYPQDKMQQTRTALARLNETGNGGAGLFGLCHEDDPSHVIYVHAKVLIADDRVLLLGSANFWPPSYDRDSELNVMVWDSEVAKATRSRLWREHLLDSEASGLKDWRRLAAEAEHDRRGGRRPATRLVEIDPRRYYTFAENAVAPWQALRDG